jgi:hypothetical protein
MARAKTAVIYHRVQPHEGFAASARTIWGLTRRALADWPGRRRVLFLEVEGHRGGRGGFDRDLPRLHRFVSGALAAYLSEAHTPFARRVVNPRSQRDDMPEEPPP